MDYFQEATYVNTLAFLNQLVVTAAQQGGGGGLGLFNASEVITGLNLAQNQDGFYCQVDDTPSPSSSHYLRAIGVTYRRQLAKSEYDEPGTSSFTVDCALVALCVICAALASGLTQGLLSLEELEMNIKIRSGTAEEKAQATKVLPIISKHHLLLVTLMLWNASATEALPIFLSKLVPEYIAVIISVTLVLFAGEIIPASILTGPNQLAITSTLTPLVYLVMGLFYPLAWPIAKLLDYAIGHTDQTVYNRDELSVFINLQHEEAVRRNSSCSVMQREVNIIDGALKFGNLSVSDIMTPIEACFMISATETLSYKVLFEIFKSGYSRIPVYENDDRSDIIGLMLAKDLLFVDPEDETPVRAFVEHFGRKAAVAWQEQVLGDILPLFIKERTHMAIVNAGAKPEEKEADTNNGEEIMLSGGGGSGGSEGGNKNQASVHGSSAGSNSKIIGLLTLEDIIEEILGVEIGDEHEFIDTSKVESMKPQTFRDMDIARMTLLKENSEASKLSAEEQAAVISHLLSNVPQLQSLFQCPPELELDGGGGTSDDGGRAAVAALVEHGMVLDLMRKSMEEYTTATVPSYAEDVLYKKGKMSSVCTLVLSGRIGYIDSEGVLSSVGAWGILGAEALIEPVGTYIPDFTAFLSSESVRVIQFSSSTRNNVPISSALAELVQEQVLLVGGGGEGGEGVEVSPKSKLKKASNTSSSGDSEQSTKPSVGEGDISVSGGIRSVESVAGGSNYVQPTRGPFGPSRRIPSQRAAKSDRNINLEGLMYLSEVVRQTSEEVLSRDVSPRGLKSSDSNHSNQSIGRAISTHSARSGGGWTGGGGGRGEDGAGATTRLHASMDGASDARSNSTSSRTNSSSNITSSHVSNSSGARRAPPHAIGTTSGGVILRSLMKKQAGSSAGGSSTTAGKAANSSHNSSTASPMHPNPNPNPHD